MTRWPPAIGDAALHGPAGEFVRRSEPHSEAHPVALLAQFLVGFGTACGRGAHYQVEADSHYPNEFCVLVGPSAKGRKGSSWGHVRRVLAEADPGFVTGCLASGLSSGEGLIAQVRDQMDEADGDAPADKRRLVLEQEFAQVLKVLSREGNTCSRRSSAKPGTARRCRRWCATTRCAPTQRTSGSSGTSPRTSCCGT
jgi:hypothetical protein